MSSCWLISLISDCCLGLECNRVTAYGEPIPADKGNPRRSRSGCLGLLAGRLCA